MRHFLLAVVLLCYFYVTEATAVYFEPVPPPGVSSSSLVPTQTDKNFVYVNTDLGLFRSDSGGTNWLALGQINDTPGAHFVAHIGETLLATTDVGLHRYTSADGWQLIFDNNGATLFEDSLGEVVVNPAGEAEFFVFRRRGKAFFSSDGGNIWADFANYDDFRGARFLNDAQQLVLLVDDGLPANSLSAYDLSTGVWTDLSMPNVLPGLYPLHLSREANSSGRIMLHSPGIYYSDDLGARWISAPYPEPRFGAGGVTRLNFSQISQQLVIADVSAQTDLGRVPEPSSKGFGFRESFLSTDGGETWASFGQYQRLTFVGRDLYSDRAGRPVGVLRNFVGRNLSIPALTTGGFLLLTLLIGSFAMFRLPANSSKVAGGRPD